MAADVISQIPPETRRTELRYIASELDLEFVLVVAQLLHEEDGSPSEWTTEFRSRLTARTKEFVLTRWANLDEADQQEFALFKTWGKLEPEGIVREFAQTLINEGRWDIIQYLPLITSTNHLLGVPDPAPHLSELDEPWVEYFLGIDYASQSSAGDSMARSSRSRSTRP